MANQHLPFMQEALAEAETALAAGEFPVGCVLVSGNEIVAKGRRKNSKGNLTELDHAEIIALRSLAASPLSLPGPLIAYATMEPCLMCFAALLLNNINTIVYAYEDVMGGGSATPLEHLPPLYGTMVPKVIAGIGRRESLALFQRFFSDPANSYWSGSLLADYTLRQEP